jgi:hypothetical protein
MTRPSWSDYATGDESASADLLRGIVAHWVPALGPSGLRLHDVSGRSNWGTLANMDAATDWVIDGGQYALDFDGSNDRVLSVSSAGLPTGSANRTIAVWFNITTDGNYSLFGYGTSGSNERFNLFRSTSLIGTNVIGIEITNSYILSPFVNDSLWHHLAVSYPGGTLSGASIYLDGKAVSPTVTVNGTNTPNTGVGVLTAGVLPNLTLYSFNGRMDDFALWSRALSANEIQTVYNLGRGGMLRRRRRRRAYIAEAAFKAYWARQQTQLIGGGV